MGDRNCIDLVCIAGKPLSSSSSRDNNETNVDDDYDDDNFKNIIANLNQRDDVLTEDEFDSDTYESSAKRWSGKYPKLKERIILAAYIVVCCIVGFSITYAIFIFVKKYRLRKEKKKMSISNRTNVVTNQPSSSDTSESLESL